MKDCYVIEMNLKCQCESTEFLDNLSLKVPGRHGYTLLNWNFLSLGSLSLS